MDVVDRASYDQEQAIIAADDLEAEYTEKCVAEGSAFSVVVPTGIDVHGNETGSYLLIRVVELEDAN